MFGTEKQEAGLLFKGDNFAVVKKVGDAGDTVEKHNHPTENIVLAPVKGKVKITLNETEEHVLTPGAVLHFDGENFIQGEFLEAGEFVVTLVRK